MKAEEGFGDKLLIDGLSFNCRRAACRHEPNAGKSTLFRMITGQEKPDEGKITIRESVNPGYVNNAVR